MPDVRCVAADAMGRRLELPPHSGSQGCWRRRRRHLSYLPRLMVLSLSPVPNDSALAIVPPSIGETPCTILPLRAPGWLAPRQRAPAAPLPPAPALPHTAPPPPALACVALRVPACPPHCPPRIHHTHACGVGVRRCASAAAPPAAPKAQPPHPLRPPGRGVPCTTPSPRAPPTLCTAHGAHHLTKRHTKADSRGKGMR